MGGVRSRHLTRWPLQAAYFWFCLNRDFQWGGSKARVSRAINWAFVRSSVDVFKTGRWGKRQTTKRNHFQQSAGPEVHWRPYPTLLNSTFAQNSKSQTWKGKSMRGGGVKKEASRFLMCHLKGAFTESTLTSQWNTCRVHSDWPSRGGGAKTCKNNPLAYALTPPLLDRTAGKPGSNHTLFVEMMLKKKKEERILKRTNNN